MVGLGNVLGALISQIGIGRSQADIASLEVAQIYKDNPLLSEYPVPRMVLDEVVVDLKISIAVAPTLGFPTKEARIEALIQLGEAISNLPRIDPSLIELNEKTPQFKKIWTSASKKVIERLSELVPEEAEIEPKSVAYSTAALVSGQLLSAALELEEKFKTPEAKEFLLANTRHIEERLIPHIQEIISKALQVHPPAINRLDVLVSTSELQAIPPEKLTTLKLTLRESDRIWTQIETQPGVTKDKLVPS